MMTHTMMVINRTFQKIYYEVADVLDMALLEIKEKGKDDKEVADQLNAIINVLEAFDAHSTINGFRW